MLIEFARSQGETITARQLKRWRADRLLPPRTVRGRGRARGVVGIDAPWTRFQVVAVHRALVTERNSDLVALRLWYAGWDIPTELIVNQLDTRLEIDRKQLANLEGQLDDIGGERASGFDIAEADSRSLPITHDEIGRMRDAARSTGEPARDLVHAVRAATEGQLFSSSDEVSAIPDDLAKQYFGFYAIQQLIVPLSESLEPCYDRWESLIQTLDIENVLTTPTKTQLLTARSTLRRLYDAVEMIRTYKPAPNAPLFAVMAAVFEVIPMSFDPRASNYHAERLLLGLRTCACVANPLHSE